jgi:hypothetical protein
VHSEANTIAFSETIYNTNFVTAAIGLRGVGTGQLSVSGLSGPVTRSYLYWHGPTNTSDPHANARVTINGVDIIGTNIGLSHDNFWGYANSHAYRADVTELVRDNGTYVVGTGQLPPDVVMNGAALISFFNDSTAQNKRDVVLFHGNDSNFSNVFDAPGWSVSLSGINYTGGDVLLSLIVADGQDFGPNDDGDIRVNGTVIASGGLFQGRALAALGADVSGGSLFDVERFDITSMFGVKTTTLDIRLDEGVNDAFSTVLIALDLPSGAAPRDSVIPEPSTYCLSGAGLLLLAACGRRKRDRKDRK